MDPRTGKLHPFTWQHILYRLYGLNEYDYSRPLLYVGITGDLYGRFKQHDRATPWWGEVRTCELELHPSRAALKTAERVAIKTEHPLYNVAVPRKRRLSTDEVWEWMHDANGDVG
jgi:predicted GIY-YIG superfamily endonuclease